MDRHDPYDDATRAAEDLLRTEPTATRAAYDTERDVLRVWLSNELEVAVPRRLLQGLATARPENLGAVEITPSGLGLHFPDADADLYLPGLLGGMFGTRAWMRGLAAGREDTGARGVPTTRPLAPDAA